MSLTETHNPSPLFLLQECRVNVGVNAQHDCIVFPRKWINVVVLLWINKMWRSVGDHRQLTCVMLVWIVLWDKQTEYICPVTNDKEEVGRRKEMRRCGKQVNKRGKAWGGNSEGAKTMIRLAQKAAMFVFHSAGVWCIQSAWQTEIPHERHVIERVIHYLHGLSLKKVFDSCNRVFSGSGASGWKWMWWYSVRKATIVRDTQLLTAEITWPAVGLRLGLSWQREQEDKPNSRVKGVKDRKKVRVG